METLELLRAGKLAGSHRLDLSCGLTEIPPEVFELADSLEVLDLSRNQLNSLPDEITTLTKLRAIFLNSNQFEQFPEILAQCLNLSIISLRSNKISQIDGAVLSPRIRWLILTDNQLESLPPDMGNLGKLQKLMLAGNQLRSLPESMTNCHSLELLRIAANQLEAFPEWLLSLPRLSWLAYSGNPFCDAFQGSQIDSAPNPTALSLVPWMHLDVGEVLGQGASGVISKATWKTAPETAQDVAVKVFKGSLTSDGFPADEMQACITAGSHDHLISTIGKITDHPEQKEGLLFPFIPPSYKKLGYPPNLDTCTRDTYLPEVAFTIPTILRIAKGIVTAAMHLHEQGIMHGDLYPHNILFDAEGKSYLGDFGAACFYDRTQETIALAFERMEVRAFGCMLEDLLDRCIPDSSTTSGETVNQLRQMQQRCMGTVPDDRPLFTELSTEIDALLN
ncbi:MAG: leucine-rich repeat-containing protein kinase family protein [Cyanobacteria bacterium J06638_22]